MDNAGIPEADQLNNLQKDPQLDKIESKYDFNEVNSRGIESNEPKSDLTMLKNGITVAGIAVIIKMYLMYKQR